MKATPAVTAEELLDRVEWSPALSQRDLQDVSSLPDLSAEFAEGRTWADVHFDGRHLAALKRRLKADDGRD